MQLPSYLDYNKIKKKEFITDMIFYAVMILIVLFFLFLNTFWIDTRYISGSSMNNTLVNGDILILNKLKEPKQFDVIVFVSDRGDDYIKRVIGIPGDTVYTENGSVVIEREVNGEVVKINLDEPYANHPNRSYYVGTTKDIERTYVDEGKLFVLGDNRINSRDSRSFGVIDKSQVKGVVTQFWIDNKEIVTKLFKYIKHTELGE